MDRISHRRKAGMGIRLPGIVIHATVNHLAQFGSDGCCSLRNCSKPKARTHRKTWAHERGNDDVGFDAIQLQRIDQPKERHSAPGQARRIGLQEMTRSSEVERGQPSRAIVA